MTDFEAIVGTLEDVCGVANVCIPYLLGLGMA